MGKTVSVMGMHLLWRAFIDFKMFLGLLDVSSGPKIEHYEGEL